jgi:RNA polymerase sigma-70 factor (ECF subfamily)
VEGAMTELTNGLGFAPERYREYLHLFARQHLPNKLQRLLSASDVAHETILKAHTKRAQFRGQTEAEYRAWLRRILANTLADAAKAEAREPDILQALEKSSAVFEDWVVDEGFSPVEQAVQDERLLRLAEALLQLPEDERRALEMRHLRMPPCSLPEIAKALNRPTAKAVAGLLARGLERLRGLLRERS